MRNLWVVTVGLLILAGCAKEQAGKEITAESGLKFVDLEIGSGESPRTGQEVTVHYTGWLEEGTKFDSSRDR